MSVKDREQILGKKVKIEPVEPAKTSVDLDNSLEETILEASVSSTLRTDVLESFSTIAQNRESEYELIDTMAMDSTMAAALETYAEDIVQTNSNGEIFWIESKDAETAKYVSFLVKKLDLDKQAYKWAYMLTKYGDVYVRLVRQSELDNSLIFGKKDKGKEKLQEDVNIVVNDKNDHYADLLDTVRNPGEMFELVKFGKTIGYIKAPVNVQKDFRSNNDINSLVTYRIKRNDVTIYGATEFAHACLESSQTRADEDIDIFMNDDDYESDIHSETFNVRRGAGIFNDLFKVWRQLSLMENSILLSRLTRSSITRLLQMEIGDMPKSKVQQVTNNIRSLLEHKNAFEVNSKMSEYINPGPVENIVILPTRNGKGAINMASLGGDYDPKQLTDLNWFNNKLFGGLKIPKQFLCLRGNVEIPLLDGETLSIEEMYKNKEKYIGKGILSCNEDGFLVPTTIENILLTRKDASFVRVYLDNGESFDVTPDHKVMLRDGSFKEAKDLTENDSLMPYYTRYTKDGRLEVLDNKTGKYKKQYRMVAEYYEKVPKGHQVHHKGETIKKIVDKYDLRNYIPECNHKVIKVEKLNIVEDAYDLSVRNDSHTFPISAGVFIHNCWTDDNTGFNGGTSLTILSSNYGKAIIKMQKMLCQMVTDILNFTLIDKGYKRMINNFRVCMQKPVTQEDIDKKSDLSNELRNVSDIMNTLGDMDDNISKMKILNSLLSKVVADQDITNIIQEYIDKLESKEEKEGDKSEDNNTPLGSESAMGASGGLEPIGGESFGDLGEEEESSFSPLESAPSAQEELPEESGVEETPSEEDNTLPSPEELGVDLTQNPQR